MKQHFLTHVDTPPELQEALLAGVTPVEPAPQRREAMRQNILERVRTDRKSFITVRHNEGNWEEIALGIYRKRLIQTGKISASLYRMLPGSSFPAHDHPSDEECVCLEGEASLGGIVVREGDFHLAPKGVPHGTVTSKDGCLLYIRVACEETLDE